MIIGGPVGTREYVSRLLLDGYGSHIRREVDVNVAPEYVALQDGSDIELAGYRVQSHAVVHSTGPSLAYRITDARGVSIGFSGDSEMCGGLRRSIRACDLFVCECTGWDGPAPGGHLWRDEVASLMVENPRHAFPAQPLERAPPPARCARRARPAQPGDFFGHKVAWNSARRQVRKA